MCARLLTRVLVRTDVRQALTAVVALFLAACQDGPTDCDGEGEDEDDSASPEGPGGGGETETGSGDDPDPGIPCDTPDPVVNSTAVQAGCDRLWSGSNPDAPMADRRERGGWVVQRDGGYVLEPYPDDWTQGACGIDPPPNTVPPAGAVAWVHTHPYSRGESLTICTPTRFELGGRTYLVYETYQNLPSGEDALTAEGWNLRGYILDKDAITGFLPDLTTTRTDDFEITSQIARCGYGS